MKTTKITCPSLLLLFFLNISTTLILSGKNRRRIQILHKGRLFSPASAVDAALKLSHLVAVVLGREMSIKFRPGVRTISWGHLKGGMPTNSSLSISPPIYLSASKQLRSAEQQSCANDSICSITRGFFFG